MVYKRGFSVVVHDYLKSKKRGTFRRSASVVDLINTAKNEREKERRGIYLLATASLSLLFFSVFLLSI